MYSEEEKGGNMVVLNTNKLVVPIRPVVGWRVCMDYQKLNSWIEKDYFPMPFIDKILDYLMGRDWNYFDGYVRYNQIYIDLENQEKTTFAYIYTTNSFKCMSFWLTNTPAIFYRCMFSVFLDMMEDTI